MFDLLEEKKGWLDGVVVSGGEPLLQPKLPALLGAIKERGPGVKLDTNGTSPDTLAQLIDEGLVDYVAMDVKAPLEWGKYEEVAGVGADLSAIQQTIDLLIDGPVDYEFRTTVCPQFTDGDDILGIAQAVAGAKRLILQQFRAQNMLDSALLEVKPYQIETLQEFAEIAAPHVEECYVRGAKGVGE